MSFKGSAKKHFYNLIYTLIQFGQKTNNNYDLFKEKLQRFCTSQPQ